MLYLVRYGEIGLKSSQVRRRLRDRLVTNIQDSFLNEGVECLTSAEEGRVYVRSENHDVASHILSRTFGVVSFSPVEECSSSMEDIKESVMEHFRDDLKEGTSFAIRARRTGDHPYSSQELAVELGSAVLSSFEGLKVNLREPDVEIFVEVRGSDVYLYREVIPGPAGLPLGSQGKVLCLVGNVQDAVSCWLMMKRGCKVHFAHKNSTEFIKVLESWDPKPRSHRIKDDAEFDALAEKLKVEGLVLGNDVDNLEFEKKEFLAIFYPVVGFTPEEISSLARQIGLEDGSH
jgi:thiamine biosynthesis protein ThiI